jgi:uncharacterized protein (TIGR02145 family)
LTKDTQQGKVQVLSVVGQETIRDTVGVFVNGVFDSNNYYYRIIRIGNQVWMAENLNVGVLIGGGMDQTDFKVIKRYCYNNDDSYCNTYGGLYTWDQMMLGANQDNGNIGITRGICTVGWHVPTISEWNTLASYLYEPVAGVKIKEAGTAHWKTGNVATNESDFTALPGGMWDGTKIDLHKQRCLSFRK